MQKQATTVVLTGLEARFAISSPGTRNPAAPRPFAGKHRTGKSRQHRAPNVLGCRTLEFSGNVSASTRGHWWAGQSKGNASK